MRFVFYKITDSSTRWLIWLLSSKPCMANFQKRENSIPTTRGKINQKLSFVVGFTLNVETRKIWNHQKWNIWVNRCRVRVKVDRTDSHAGNDVSKKYLKNCVSFLTRHEVRRICEIRRIGEDFCKTTFTYTPDPAVVLSRLVRINATQLKKKDSKKTTHRF